MRRILEDTYIRNIEIVEEDKEENVSGEYRKDSVKPDFSTGKNVSEKFAMDSLKTADPVTLLLMCYGIAKDSLEKAIEGISTKNYELKYEGISKAMKVFDLLMATTEPNEVGKQLISSYLLITQKITEADIKKDIQTLKKVIGYINELEEAWKKVKNKSR